MKNFKRKEVKGFTIIELVVVIAVIAILAAVLIPTFSNLVKKANMSADMQVVKNMNTALTTDEIINGKPSTVVEAQEVLIANGISNFKTHDNNNQYYWLGSDNRIILWDKVELEVTYPEEYKKLFKEINSVQDNWSVLGYSYETRIEGTDSKEIASSLIDAVKTAKDGTLIQLPKDSTIDMGEGGLAFMSNGLKSNQVGKTVTIDLNGSLLKSTTPHSNGWYYGLDVPVGGTLSLLNGEIEITTMYVQNPAISVTTGGHLFMQDITLKTNGAGIYPNGDASEIVIDSCTINGGTYGIGTNNMESSNIKINVKNSTITGTNAFIVNTPSNTYIENSIIEGEGWGLIVREGHVVVKDSTIKTTDGDPGTGSTYSCDYKDFSYTQSSAGAPFWGQGYQMPYSVVVVGDYSAHDAYDQESSLELYNVILTSANSTKIPEVLMAAGPQNKTSLLTYDSSTTINNLVIFGDDYQRSGIEHNFQHNGIIKINGKEQLK